MCIRDRKYDTVTADTPFYGVYCGQSALPLAPDTLRYLTSETLLGCTVYDYETDSTGPVYDLPALEGEDPYSVFLSGSQSLLTITNPSADTDLSLIHIYFCWRLQLHLLWHMAQQPHQMARSR